jgi:hypothetical protein
MASVVLPFSQRTKVRPKVGAKLYLKLRFGVELRTVRIGQKLRNIYYLVNASKNAFLYAYMV